MLKRQNHVICIYVFSLQKKTLIHLTSGTEYIISKIDLTKKFYRIQIRKKVDKTTHTSVVLCQAYVLKLFLKEISYSYEFVFSQNIYETIKHWFLPIFDKRPSCIECFVFLFVTEEIPITVSRRAPDKEARPSPYHYCS